MAVELRYQHQQKTYELMKKALKENKMVAYVFPTGAGKSFPTLKYIEENPEKNTLIISPSIAINRQWKRYILKYVPNGEERLRNKQISIATYQKLSLLNKTKINPDMIVADEVHRWGADTWESELDTLLEKFPEAEKIGMSATPERMDKRNMAYEKFGANVVYEMSLTEAITGEKEDEVLFETVPRYIRALSQLEKSDLERKYQRYIERIEDNEKKEKIIKRYETIHQMIEKAPGIADVMESGMKKKNGKYYIFCKDRNDVQEKMQQAQNIFGKVNAKIRMDYLLSKTEKEDSLGKMRRQNRETLEEFDARGKTDELNLLFCVDMINEGVHLEDVDGIVLFDLTESNILYKQRIGRVFSVGRKEETVIIDAANNWVKHIRNYQEIANAVKQRGERSLEKEDFFKLIPEEVEMLDLLEEMNETARYNIGHACEELIEWLETHNGNMPRNLRPKEGEELTKEEKEERNLYQRWHKCVEKKILEEYRGRDIEEVPEEYREKIARLRNFGLGLKQKTIHEEMMEWLEAHEGKTPRGAIYKEGRILPVEEMTQEEKEEKNFYGRWNESEEKKILDEYAERDIEEVPEEWREQIAELRSWGLGLEKKKVYDPCGDYIKWREAHDGKPPRSVITKNKVPLKKEEITAAENEEKRKYARWFKCPERKIYQAYKGRDIEEVPEEYREKIRRIRELDQMQKDLELKERMKKSVGKQVRSNAQTRLELENLVKTKEETIIGES